MKATKLASIFAVTAVAAAVSTTTFAAEAVFSGEAGVEYVITDGTNELDGTDLGELELSVDTGVVYAELEIGTSGTDEGTTIGMEKLYVKQGAVSFGRFDGSLATGSFMGMDEIGYTGVDLNTTESGDTDNTGIRYAVTPELTVSVESTTSTATDDSDIGVALSYVADMDGFKAGVSGGSVGDSSSVNVGVQTTMDALTLSVNYGVGELSGADASEVGFSVALAASEALTLTLQVANDLEAEETGTYFIGEYAVGDLTYYVENYTGDGVTYDDGITKVGVTASF
ncbi:hypothetical protein MUS1_08880 [Marinomonas ushuaiensis DSM 15871]|uniref:Porin domain-containing protein n=1 Tax=Marinomonas ushuaiensis DSM 15871 TaxID=1122207 RepID=X7E0U7_9GAMM|nr:hypothetical protein [Marinomonas ushuaiensis]ETX09455.1 hypothetical protein MUS1_08880 [Marinomonas ushuaiensis DSM 15871]